MTRPSHIRLGEVSAFKRTYCCIALLVAFFNASILAPFSFSLQPKELGTGSISPSAEISTQQTRIDRHDPTHLFDADESSELANDLNHSDNLFPEGQLLVAQPVYSVHALPQTFQQISSRTEVRAPASEEDSLAPKMKGIPISHFQNEDASFWASSVTRVQPSSLRVYRI
ncbi:hypothetical protein HQ496_01250 [bacterium]|nr:hypothetical protein [bacterium]